MYWISPFPAEPQDLPDPRVQQEQLGQPEPLALPVIRGQKDLPGLPALPAPLALPDLPEPRALPVIRGQKGLPELSALPVLPAPLALPDLPEPRALPVIQVQKDLPDPQALPAIRVQKDLSGLPEKPDPRAPQPPSPSEA